MLFPCTVRVHCRLDRTQGPARHLGLDPYATDRSRRHLIMQILSLVNHLDSSKNRADSLARSGRIALKKCQKTLVHRKPSVKRLECYVWRLAKACGEAITKKKGHRVAGGQATLWFRIASDKLLVLAQAQRGGSHNPRSKDHIEEPIGHFSVQRFKYSVLFQR